MPGKSRSRFASTSFSRRMNSSFFSAAPGTGTNRPSEAGTLTRAKAERADVLPDVPTIAEFVPGYEAGGWYGIGVPRSVPAEIVDKLNREINASLADAKLKTRLADLGYTTFGSSPAVGSRLLVGHPEIVGKGLASLTFNVEWMGAPADPGAYYANYGLASPFDPTVSVSLIDRSAVAVLSSSAKLFDATKKPKAAITVPISVPAPGRPPASEQPLW